MTILLYKADAEVAQKVLDFFDKNPSKRLCLVGIGNKGAVTFLRREMPRLKEIVSCQPSLTHRAKGG